MLHRAWLRYGLACTVAALSIALLHLVQPHANLATVALVMVLGVTAVAVTSGSGAALLAAVLCGLGFNFFFIPPVHTWSITGPQNWIAFGVFVAVAIIVGQLSAHATRKAEEAEQRRVEFERLSLDSRRAFEEAAQAEMLRRSEKMKTALLDAVTHDLRTPLTSIKVSATTLLGEGRDDTIPREGRRELLEVIDEEADRLNRFIDEMTELARIEAGRLPLERAAAPVEEIVSNAIDRAGKILARHTIAVQIEPGLPPLDVDAIAISAVVFELLENAAKYSPPDSRIEVRARTIDPMTAEISVADDGRGIPPALRERVFEKFFRGGDDATAESPQIRAGFGLGLAIARGIVEAHGHHIWASSGQDGRGTVVAFTVPCAPAAAASDDAREADERISATHSRS